MRQLIKFKSLFALLFLVSLITACTQKKGEFKELTVGMTAEDVHSKMGEPTKKETVTTGENWYYGDNQMVVISDGKVTAVIDDVAAENKEMEEALDEVDDALDEMEEGIDKMDTTVNQ